MKATRDQIQVFVPPPPGWIWFGKILNWFVVWFADGWTDGFWLTFLWQMTSEQCSLLYCIEGYLGIDHLWFNATKGNLQYNEAKHIQEKRQGTGSATVGLCDPWHQLESSNGKPTMLVFKSAIKWWKQTMENTGHQWRIDDGKKQFVSCTSFYFPIILCFQPSALRIDPEPLPPPNLRKETPSLVTSPSPIHPLEWQTKQ